MQEPVRLVFKQKLRGGGDCPLLPSSPGAGWGWQWEAKQSGSGTQLPGSVQKARHGAKARAPEVASGRTGNGSDLEDLPFVNVS